MTIKAIIIINSIVLYNIHHVLYANVHQILIYMLICYATLEKISIIKIVKFSYFFIVVQDKF